MILRVDPHFIQIKRLKVVVVAAAATVFVGGDAYIASVVAYFSRFCFKKPFYW